MASASHSRKRKKNFYCNKSKRNPNHELSLGMKGILITSNGSEKMCVREAYNLLNEMADTLYGCEDKVTMPLDSSDSSDGNGADDDDIDKRISEEVMSLKETKERRFQSLFSGAKNLIFIKCRDDVDPGQLVLRVLTDARDTKIQKARFCCRFFPVSVVCSASLSEIKRHALPIISEYFHGLDPRPIEFAVHCKCRNNNVIKRSDVIDLVASLVTNESAYPHVVNLAKPELVIIVMVIKNMCCMSIVKDFHSLNEYNIQSFYSPMTPQKDTSTDSLKSPPKSPPKSQET